MGPELGKVEGAKLFLQVAQDLTVGGRSSRTQYQYTLQGSDPSALNEWAPKLLAKLQTLPQLRDVATDQQANGTTLTLTFDRDQASRYGLTAQMIDDTLYDAFGQRQIAQYFTQLSSYEVIMELLPSLQNDLSTLEKIFLKSPTTGGEVPLSVFAKWSSVPVAPLSISHQGQFPAVTISFNLAPGVALGQATQAIQQAQNGLQLPASIIASFQGNAQAFQDSLSSVPLLILGALVVVYLILGILYESYIHPITIISTLPSAGAGAIAMLMLFQFDFSLIALIGIVLLIGIVKKNGIMLVDFAIAAERDDHLSASHAVARRGHSDRRRSRLIEPDSPRLLAGDVAEATRLLGRPHRIRGTVGRGAGRGAGLGFPTANLTAIDTLIAADGVYAARAFVDGGEPSRAAACNIGPNPTFGDQARKVEAHLLGFSGDLYGQRVELEFIKRLRATRRFSGLDELIQQVRSDIEETRLACDAAERP